MAIRPPIRTDYSGKGVWRTIAAGLNRLGQWCNDFEVGSGPISCETNRWGVVLGWQPWESPFIHPWQVYPAETAGKVNVRGGDVCTGATIVAVSALADETAADEWRAWLKVKHYYNTATASEYAIESGTSWPTTSHTSTAQTTYIPIAEIEGTTLYQYLYSEVFVPRIPPPVPDLTNTYYYRCAAGVLSWRLAGDCTT